AAAPSQQATEGPTPASIAGATEYSGWYTFNGNLENQKYAEADQITPQNVTQLQKAWEVHTGDVSDGSDLPPKFHPAAVRVRPGCTPIGAGGATGDGRSWSGLRSRSPVAVRFAA